MITIRVSADIKDDRRVVLILPPEVPLGKSELVVSVAPESKPEQRRPRSSLADWAEENAEHWGNRLALPTLRASLGEGCDYVAAIRAARHKVRLELKLAELLCSSETHDSVLRPSKRSFVDRENRAMFKTVLRTCTAILLGLCCVGCDRKPQQPAGNGYPPVLPIWIVEDDPNITIFERKDLGRDRKVGEMLVIPLYRYFQHEGATEFLAIAHPFVYGQGDDIEKHLSSFEQRENLQRLIFWVPGYFPDGLGRTPSWTPIINDKRMIVVELQRCLGSEEGEINAAMKKLLLNGDFVIEKMLVWKVRPPYSNDPTRVKESYDFARLVRSEVFEGRFFKYGTAKDHVLWGFKPGTKIINRLSDVERKAVAAFAAEATKRKMEQERKKQEQVPSRGL